MANMNSLTEANQSIIYLFLKKKRRNNKQATKATTKLLINIFKRWKKREYFLLRSKRHWFKIAFVSLLCAAKYRLYQTSIRLLYIFVL